MSVCPTVPRSHHPTVLLAMVLTITSVVSAVEPRTPRPSTFKVGDTSWCVWGEQTTAAVDESMAHGRGRALRVVDAGGEVGHAISPRFDLDPGVEWLVRAWLKVDEKLANTAVLSLRQQDHTGRVVADQTIGSTTGTDWREVSASVEIALNCSWAVAVLSPASSSDERHGAAWIDDISFVAVRQVVKTTFRNATRELGLNGMDAGPRGPGAWGDFNNDGFVDLIARTAVWRNDGGKGFTALVGHGWGVWCDVDNDGFLDIVDYLQRKVFHNLAGRDFQATDMPELPVEVVSVVSCGDFDGDGYVDIYLGGGEAWPSAQFPDVMLRNDRDGTFSVVWKQDFTTSARGATACDFDEDADLDIYVSNYRRKRNVLWQNDGEGGLTEVADQYGAIGGHGHTIGSAWGDLDNDGHFDLFVGNFSHPGQPPSQFLRNTGPDGGYHFEDRSSTAKIFWQESYGTPALGDYDNDGDLDLYFTTVYGGDRSVLFRNDGGWKFTDVTEAEGLGGVACPTYQAAWADFDNDGDLDLATDGRLYRNAGNANRWLKVRLEGDGKSVNRAAIGAQVRIELDDQILTRQVEAGTGVANQNDLTLHFGLGGHGEPIDIKIAWPDGTSQVERHVPVNRVIEVRYAGR